MNPFAPPAVAGVNSAAPAGFIDVDFTYVHDFTLAAGAELYGQLVPISQDADFILRGMHFSQPAAAAGPFNFRIADSQGYQLSNGLVSSGNLSNSAARPTPVFPEMLFPAGSQITVDIENPGAGAITTQICFRGVKRFRLAAAA